MGILRAVFVKNKELTKIHFNLFSKFAKQFIFYILFFFFAHVELFYCERSISSWFKNN